MSIGGGMRYRADGRTPGQMRPVSIELDAQKWAAASLIYRQGDTHVLCAATVEDRVPPHLRGKGSGWVTAEYAMLPAATSERMQRELVNGKLGGRTYEIQRLIGRSLRGVVDTSVWVSAPWSSTATCSRPTAAPAARRSPAATSRWCWPCARSAWSGRSPARSRPSAWASWRTRALLDLEYPEDSTARGGLQRHRHRCRHLRRGAGNRGGQALRPRPDGPLLLARRRRARRSSSDPGGRAQGRGGASRPR